MVGRGREEEDWEPVVLDALTSWAVDGFLLCSVQPPTVKEQAALQGKAVMVDAFCRGLPSLQLDIEAGMHAAMTHLLYLGHRRIAHLAAAVDAETFHLRHQAYVDALQAAKCSVTAAYQVHAPFTIADADEATRLVLERSDPPSAIVCDSEVLAVRVGQC